MSDLSLSPSVQATITVFHCRRILRLIRKQEKNIKDGTADTLIICPELYLTRGVDLLLLPVIVIMGDRIEIE